MFPYTLPKTLTAMQTDEMTDKYTSYDVSRTAGNRRRIAQVTIYPNGSILAVRAALYNTTEHNAWSRLAAILELTPYETLTGYSHR